MLPGSAHCAPEVYRSGQVFCETNPFDLHQTFVRPTRYDQQHRVARVGWDSLVEMTGNYSRWLKRPLDVAFAFLALLLLSPILGLIALLVRLRLGRAVLFRQQRPGLHGKPFILYKFRTMTEARDTQGRLMPDAERLTLFGRWLRTTSLDELPELWNILKGDMSLVGPRPLLMEYLDLYTPEQMRRHDVRPGITGWAQVNGRNALTWEARFELDVWYVDHCSLWLDARILWLTLVSVLKREGISAEGHATMPKFTGSGS